MLYVLTELTVVATSLCCFKNRHYGHILQDNRKRKCISVFIAYKVVYITQVYEVENFVTETGGTPEPRPFFEDPESNITVQLGAEVYMHCRVQNLQNTLKVSYIFFTFINIDAHIICEFTRFMRYISDL